MFALALFIHPVCKKTYASFLKSAKAVLLTPLKVELYIYISPPFERMLADGVDHALVLRKSHLPPYPSSAVICDESV